MGQRTVCSAAVLLTSAVVPPAAVVADDLPPPPHFKVVLLNHTDRGQSQCDGRLVMAAFDDRPGDVTTTVTSGPQDAVAAFTWSCRGRRDVYHVACKFPVGGVHEVTSETDVEFDGTRHVVFKGEHLLVAVELQAPPGVKATSRPAVMPPD